MKITAMRTGYDADMEAIEKLEKQLTATRERLEWHEAFAEALEWALDDGTIKEGKQ